MSGSPHICSGLHLNFGIPHTRDCYPSPTLSRQDATLQEKEYPIRQKAKVWFKENYPEHTQSGKEEGKNNDKKEDLGHNDSKKT